MKDPKSNTDPHFPVTNWQLTPVLGQFAVLDVEYASTPDDLAKTPDSRLVIRLAMSPQMCLDLAEKLQKSARAILDQPRAPGRPN